MGTFGDILREQAPELVSNSQNRIRNNILTSFPDIPEELLVTGETRNLIEWFLSDSILKVQEQEQEFEAMRSDAESRLIFGMNKDIFFLLGETQQKLRELLKISILNAYDSVADFDNIITSQEVTQFWKKRRKELKRILNRTTQSHEFPRESKEQFIFTTFKNQHIDVGDLSLENVSDDVIREFSHFLSQPSFLTQREFLKKPDKKDSRWSVFKFGKTTGYRMIMIDNTIIGIYSHPRYESDFLEPLYNGFSFPPKLSGRYKHLLVA